MLNESLVVVTSYLHTAKNCSQNICNQTASNFKKCTLCLLSLEGRIQQPVLLRCWYHVAFRDTQHRVIWCWNLTHSKRHSEVCLWWTQWRKLLEGRLLTETHTIKQIMQAINQFTANKKCNCIEHRILEDHSLFVHWISFLHWLYLDNHLLTFKFSVFNYC